MIAVIQRGIYLYKNIFPRKTQIIALALFLIPHVNFKGILGNVRTGEGKSMIVAMLATSLALIG